MNLASFRIRYPEFARADDTLVQAHLDEAEGGLDPAVYGTRFDEAHGLLTAHTLSISPFGRALRQEGDEESLYLNRYMAVRRAMVPRMIVP